MNEVKKLYEMGITTSQTLYYLKRLKEKEPTKVITVEQEPRVPLKFVGELRYNEFGDIIHPPVAPSAPEPIDQSTWKRITPRRRKMLAQYRRDMEDYEVALVEYEKAMDEWLKLPTNNKTKMESILEGYEELGRVLRSDRGFVLLDVLPKPYKPIHKVEILEVREEIQTLFTGEASQPRRKYKRNRSIPKEDWADTDLETGERRQKTLFNCNTSSKPRRIVDYEVIDRFEEKPNAYLGRAYLDYILNGVPLTDWQKFQINKRIRQNGGYRVEYQSTL